MIILDTNVISALMREAPDRQVVAWLDAQPRTSMWITSVSVLEVRYGLFILASGKRRGALMAAFETLLNEVLGGRIASFDTAAAQHAAELMAQRRQQGRTVELRDTLIAGIALASRATLATRNTAHFEDSSIKLVNPWAA